MKKKECLFFVIFLRNRVNLVALFPRMMYRSGRTASFFFFCKKTGRKSEGIAVEILRHGVAGSRAREEKGDHDDL